MDRFEAVDPTADLLRDEVAIEEGELLSQSITVATRAIAILAVCMLLVAAFGFNRADWGLVGVVAALLFVALAGRAALHHHTHLASGALAIGLPLAFAAAVRLFPPSVVAPWGTIVVLAAAPLGWPWGALAATGASAALLAAGRADLTALGDAGMASALGTIWCGLCLVRMAMRPVRVALAYASNGYAEARAATRRARERQAELARVTRGLEISNHLLEQLSHELERARRAEQEARRLKAQFAAAVSHELRTPLNLIIGFCEMMVLSPSASYGRRLPPAYRDDLEAIYRNACHISALVDDILDLSQVDADRMALHREWAPIPELVTEAVAPVATLIRDRGLSLGIELDAGLPQLFVDRTRIRQILINLLNNAARFTDEGAVTIVARRDGETVVLGVRDTGVGIPADELPRVFDEFHQVGDAARRRGGTGLGLAVSRAFAELHGGTMWAESVIGEGSTFALRLPIAADRHAGDEHVTRWGADVGARVRGRAERTVLVLDELGDTRRVFERYLDGYRILTADDLRRHVGEAVAETLHAVVVGSASAREQWRGLARRTPAWQAVPIIYCPLQTAHHTAAELGVAGYLVKPIGRDQLRAALRRLGRAVASVLVVEDDDEMRGMLARMVRSCLRGVSVATAADGDDALARMRAGRPDVVLLDLLLPSLDGYGVLGAMRGDPSLAQVPVLVITARGTHSDAVVASQLSVSQPGGMTVAEVMRWLRGGLDSLFAPGTNAPAPR